VRDLAGTQPWVLAVAGGRTERRAVKLGLRGDGRVEITEGVMPGDLVVPSTALLVKPGERLRPVIRAGA
jgi:HlyD family secretion protein